MAVVVNGEPLQVVKKFPSQKYVILTWFIENQSDVKWNREVVLQHVNKGFVSTSVYMIRSELKPKRKLKVQIKLEFPDFLPVDSLDISYQFQDRD